MTSDPGFTETTSDFAAIFNIVKTTIEGEKVGLEPIFAIASAGDRAMNIESTETDRLHAAARGAVQEVMARYGVAASPMSARIGHSSPMRAGRTLPDLDAPPRLGMVLIDRGEGAMEWRSTAPTAAAAPIVGATPVADRVVMELAFDQLPPNRILERLQSLDAATTPDQGLRRWRAGVFQPLSAVPPIDDRPDAPDRDLLVIHGTFSNSENLFDQLAAAESDSGFLAWASARYRHILTFDHPTLSVSPVLNAMDLARLFADVRRPVDVICHSRGGLVARWWLEAFGGAGVAERRVVFVASPLGGTSLASPHRLRKAFDLFTTVGAHLRETNAATSIWMPFMSVAVGLMQVFISITGSAATSPAADLFFCAVPGLGAMSRVGNSPELQRLRSGASAVPPYFGISSDFQMESAGWRFWRLFQEPRLRAASWGADLVFEQANDLVVDVASTYELFQGVGVPRERRLELGPNGTVHHTNYFLQPKVLGKIREFLG